MGATSACLLKMIADPNISQPTKEAIKLVNELPDEQKKAVAQAMTANVPPPNQEVANKIWLIVIYTIAFAAIASVAVLCAGYFFPAASAGIKPETILTIFTTATAFLAGLFAPSPVENKSTH
jgi:polyferredoxin